MITRGTLILDNLQILNWCMTVAKTDKKTIIFNFLFCKKGTNITESEPFFKFCISNRLLSKLMKWRDTVVTKIPADNPFYQALSQRHSCIKWWTNNANITKMTKGFWLTTRRCLWMCASNLLISCSENCADNFHLNILPILIFQSGENVNHWQCQKIPALLCMRFISPTSCPRHNICQSI